MTHSVRGRNTAPAAKSRQKSKKRSSTALAHRARARLMGFLRATSIVAVGIGLLMLTTGIRPTFWFEDSQKTNESLPTKLVEAPKPAAKICSAPQTDTPLFAKCASFFVDYSSQKKSPAIDKLFNIYVGAPEANHEAQYYSDSRDNIRVEDGALLLQARNQPVPGYLYTSARVDTLGKEDLLYGRLVVRAQMPVSAGTWPSIWLLPSDSKYANLGTAAEQARNLNDGEIDIAEAVGLYPHLVYGITHTILYHQDGIDHTYFNTVTVLDNDTAFHDYGIEWTPTSITISVDGVPYHTYAKQPNATYRQWPFDQPFHLVMNLALGGSWAGRDRTHFPTDGIDSSALPTALKVQSIRYYSYVGQQ